jgi:hypothetical protein
MKSPLQGAMGGGAEERPYTRQFHPTGPIGQTDKERGRSMLRPYKGRGRVASSTGSFV